MKELKEKVIAEIRSVYESDDVSDNAHREAAEAAADAILALPELRGRRICDLCDEPAATLRCNECAQIMASDY